MSDDAGDDRLRRYLFGELPEQDAQDFETSFFADDTLFEEVASLENELVDAYVRGVLSSGDRRRFEQGYLSSPERRAHVELARGLAGPLRLDAPGTAGARGRWPRVLAVAATVLVAIGAAGMLNLNRRLSGDVEELRRQIDSLLKQQEASRSPSTDPGSPHVQPPGSDVVTLGLVPGTVRSAATPKTLLLAPATLAVEIRLYLEQDVYRSYDATLETSAHETLWQKMDLSSHAAADGSKSVSVWLPAGILKRGDYVIELAAVDRTSPVAVATYRFGVAQD